MQVWPTFVMDQWTFAREELPYNALSEKHRAMAEEQSQRACFFIQCLGYKLRVSQQTITTATVYFHRYYTRRSFGDFDSAKPFDPTKAFDPMKFVAATCVFIACKAEDSARALSDVVEACLKVRYQFDKLDQEKADLYNETYAKWFQELKKLEWGAMETLCFDLTVSHPHEFITEYAEQINAPYYIVQAAWAFANDSLRRPLCVLYEPRLIAATCIYMAYKLRKEWPDTTDTDWNEIVSSQPNSPHIADIITELVAVYKITRTSHTRIGRPKPTNRDTTLNGPHPKDVHSSTDQSVSMKKPS